MQFSEVIGQETVKSLLLQSAKVERIPHAQLFLGNEGSGGLALAIAFAQYVLCERPTATDSCGRCGSCQKVSKLTHPDLHFSYPTVGSKVIATQFLKEWRVAVTDNPYLSIHQWLKALSADNKQGNIPKDECVAIVKKLSLKQFEGRYKILIMWLPEYLGKEGNRLLKLIEEPPDDTLFLLVAEDQELILNTILSRCQIVKINPLSDGEIAEGLQQRKGLKESEALAIARLSEGNFQEALLLAEQSENDNAKLFLEWFRVSYKGHGGDLVQISEQLSELGRENQKYFLAYALHFLREFLVLKMTGNADLGRFQVAERQAAERMMAVLDFEQVAKMTQFLDEAIVHIERNANPKILFLDLSIQLHKTFKKR